MTRVIYLHIGAPKTGTTYLQHRLARNRRSLAEHGVEYPLGITGSMFQAAIDLIDLPWSGQRDKARGEWDSLMARVRHSVGTVIVSQEVLAAATPAQVKRALDGLEGNEVHLVYSARDLARQIPAEWQEGIKHRRQASFAQFLRDVQRAPRWEPQLWFWRVQALPDVLNRWSRTISPSHVHLVTVPRPEAPREELWLRYSQALNIDPGWAPEQGAHENVSLGIAEATLIRRVNRRLRASGTLDQASYQRLVRDLVVHQFLAHRPNMVQATLPPQAYGWVEQIAEEWIDWVARSGIDVIGDLADLRPARPDEGAQWADPDRPGNPAMLDAALDMIDVLLAEAASTRREPLVDQTRKLVRFARRIRYRS